MLPTTLVTIAVAVAVTPLGGALNVIVGGEVYPVPPLVIVTAVTTPLVMVAVPVAVVPLGGGLNVTIGGAVYPLPPLMIVMAGSGGRRCGAATGPEAPRPA